MRQAIRILITLVFPLAVLTAGCGQKEESATPKPAEPAVAPAAAAPEAKKKYTIYLLPKKKGLPFYTACVKGANEAAAELGDVEFIYDGPTDGSPEKQASMIEQWALKGADVIIVSPNDPDVCAPAMRKAREKGVRVLTWDADAPPDTREFFINQAVYKDIGDALVDTMANDLGGPNAQGEVAIITARLTAFNQNQWIKAMKERLPMYPGLKLVAIKPSEEDQKLAFQVAQDFMKAYPNLKGIFAISSVAFPGAAEAVKQAGKSQSVLVTGLSTPNDMRDYLKDGTIRSVILWNTIDLGYLAIQVGEAVATGRLKPGDTVFKAGRLGDKKVVGDNVLLGKMLVFTKDNIDQYHF
jgi:rhamnose transport system substrate-binding protein